MSDQILVETDDLKKKAARLMELSIIFKEIGERISKDCLNVPSYDGQLSGPAKGAANQVVFETNVLRDAFSVRSTYMNDIAIEFENIDNDTIQLFMDRVWIVIRFIQNALTGIPPFEGDMTNGYKKFLAFEENGDLITIWFKDQAITFDLSDPSLTPDARVALKEKLEIFKEEMQDCLSHLKEYTGGANDLFWDALNLSNIPGAITSLLTGFKGVSDKISDNEEALQEADKSFQEAIDIWNGLNADDVPGKVPTP